jgi:YgiT-type zinc finger domain-containing protein
MKCVICHSADIEEKTVNEIFWVEENVILVPCRVLVCNNCGERYYNRQVMRRLEDIEKHLQSKTLALETVGQVLKLAAQPKLAPSICESAPDYDTEPSEPFDIGSPDAQP